jgi:hypothetical protein
MTGLGYNVTIVLFWLTTMSWLVWTKVLPPLFAGTPPTYARTVDETAAPVGWELLWDGQPVGSAQSEVARNTLDHTTQLWCWVTFEDLPISKLNPLKINFINEMLERTRRTISMQAESRIEIDSLGRLLSLESTVDGGLLIDPVQLLGLAEGGKLRLTIRSGDFSYKTELYLPPDRIVGDTLAPQARLPGLRIGQTWSEPVYNAFMPPTQPMEMLQAKVEREDFLLWNGQIERTLLVVYRTDSGKSHSDDPSEARGRTWVRRDGIVLQQEAQMGSSVLRFVRQAQAPPRRMRAERTTAGATGP